jgi:hypothetical protein
VRIRATQRSATTHARAEPERVVTGNESGVVKVDVVLPVPSMSQLTLVPGGS